MHFSNVLTLPARPVAPPAPPRARRYIQTFQSGFDAGLARVPVYFMQSDGGLTSVGNFSGEHTGVKQASARRQADLALLAGTCAACVP